MSHAPLSRHLAAALQSGIALRTFIARLIWLCLLPLLVLAAWLAAGHVRDLEAAHNATAANLARNFATAVDLYLGARIDGLEMLSGSPDLDGPAPTQDLYAEAQAFRHAFGSHLVIADTDGRMLLNTRVPFGQPLPPLPRPAGKAAAPTAMATGRPAVGDLFLGPVAKEPLVAIAVPVRRHDRVTYLLLATLEAARLQARADKVALPEGWYLALLDSTGKTIARRGPPDFDPQRDAEPAGRVDLPLESAPWSVVLAVPRDVYREPLTDATLVLAGGVALATLAGLLGGLLGGRRLSRAMARLADPAGGAGEAMPIAEMEAARRALEDGRAQRDAAQALTVRSEAALRESEERLRLLIDHAPAALAMFDRQMRYLAVSRRWRDDYGLGDRELLGISHYEVFPEVGEVWKAVHQAGMAGEVTRSSGDRFERADGSVQWVRWEVRPWRNLAGEVGGIVIFSEDISARKEAEAAVRASEAKYRLLAESAEDCIFWTGADGRFVYLSPACERIFGRRPEAFLADPGLLLECIHPEDRDAYAGHLAGHRLADEKEMEFRVRRPDGSEAWVAHECRPLHDEEGRYLGRRGTNRDITARKQAEETIRRLNAELSATLQAIPDLLFEADAAGTYLKVWAKNPELLARQREDLIGRTVREVLPAEAADTCMAALAEAARDGSAYGHEIRLDLEDGPHWFELSVSRKGEDAAAGFIVLSRDVSGRKRAEAELRESAARLQMALEAARAGTWEWDLDTDRNYWSDETCRLYGLEPGTAEPSYQAWLDTVRPEDRPRITGELARAVAGQDAISLEWRVNSPAGPERWLMSRGQPRQDGRGGVVRYLGIVMDITERRQLESELERHRRHLEDLVTERTRALAEANEALAGHAGQIADLYDRAPVGYHSLDPEGRVLNVNETELAMLGYAREEFVGRRIMEFMTPESREVALRKFAEFAHSGRLRDLEIDFLRKDGSLLPVLVSGDLVRDGEGRFLYTRSTLVDNSERKARERQIDEMQAELARRAEAAEAATLAKSAFLANMSHEIRTPMNAIIGLTHLMRRNNPGPEAAGRLGKIAAAAEHLLSVINDILDFSKIEAGRFSLEEREFAVGAVLANVASMMAERAEAKGLALVVEDAAHTGPLAGDPVRLQQALLNYVANAIKFTAAGIVTLRAEVLHEADDGALLRFEVRDTGIGIAPEVLPRLFSAFEQAEAATTRQYGGTGLGLAITRRLAGLMGGEAGVESVPGRGSRFWFTARLRRAALAAEAPPPMPAEAPELVLARQHRGRRILLAEDDEINREVTQGLLEEAGLAADMAEDGAQAVAMAEEKDYDLILMDMQMPRMDGLEATRLIRKMHYGERLPIIAMTANAFDEDRERCLKAGMNDHVGKPVDPDRFFATLLRWLERPAG